MNPNRVVTIWVNLNGCDVEVLTKDEDGSVGWKWIGTGNFPFFEKGVHVVWFCLPNGELDEDFEIRVTDVELSTRPDHWSMCKYQDKSYQLPCGRFLRYVFEREKIRDLIVGREEAGTTDPTDLIEGYIINVHPSTDVVYAIEEHPAESEGA